MKTFVASSRRDPAADHPDRVPFAMDEGEAVAFVRSRIEEGNRARGGALELAYTNALHFDGSRGKQWGRWSNKLGSVVYRENDPPWRVYRTINLTQPTVVTMHGMLTAQQVQWRFSAVGAGYSVTNAATDAERLVRWMYEEESLDEKRLDLILFLILHGNAFLKIVFDPDAGPPVSDPATGELLRPGRVRFDVVPMYEIVVEPDATDLLSPEGKPRARWVAHRQFLSWDEIVQMYSHMDGRLPRKSDRASMSGGRTTLASQDGTRETTSRYELVDLYHAPTTEDEHGFTIVTADDTFVAGGELPYHRATRGEVIFPFVHFGSHLRLPGEFWRVSPIEAMKGLQKTLNEMWSSLEEYVRRQPRGTTYMDEGSVCNPEDIYSPEAGGVVQLEPNARMPVSIPYQPLSPAAWQPFEIIEHFLGQMTMIREASRGQAGVNIRTAMQQFMSSQVDMKSLGPLSRRVELAEERAIRMAFALMEAFGAEGETLSVRDGAEFEFTQAAAAAVRQMFVEPGSSAPQDEMLKQTAALQAVEAGVLSRDEARERIGAAFEKDDPRSYAALNRRLARQNIKDLLRGVPVVVRPFWRHDIHLAELNRLRVSGEYLTADPQTQALVDATAAEHEKYQQMQMATMLAAAAGLPQGAAAAPASSGSPRNPLGPPSRTAEGPSGPTTAGLTNATTPRFAGGT